MQMIRPEWDSEIRLTSLVSYCASDMDFRPEEALRLSEHLIAVDWGTSRFRAYRIAGEAVAAVENDGGLASISASGFEAHLAASLAQWSGEADLPILMGGMAGARSGWREAPYVACPATGRDIAARAIRVPCESMPSPWLVPGLICRGPAGADVMRGEEVQILGILAADPDYAGPVLLPGTHSKCAQVSGGAIRGFSTAMTGDVFAALTAATILKLTAQPGVHFDEAAFRDGAQRGLARAAALLEELFAVRTRGLVDGLGPEANADYLSGLLIGAEIGGRRTVLAGATAAVPVVAAPALASRYRLVLALADIAARPVDAMTAFIDGMRAVASELEGSAHV